VLERAIVADLGLVRAWEGDRQGNTICGGPARNSNPLGADVRAGNDRGGRAPSGAG
jgi:acyl CoA:acetate/3-ketoacid CoA transferase alpha subunit